MEAKVRVARWWMLLAAAVVLALVDPQLWLSAVPLFLFPGCPCCVTIDCPKCTNGTVPNSYQVILTGWVNAACVTCTQCNGTFIVPLSGGTCTYTLSLGTICSVTKFVVVDFFAFANFRVSGCLGGIIDGEFARFEKTYSGTPISCAFSSESFPRVASSTSGCDSTASTCTVTAL